MDIKHIEHFEINLLEKILKQKFYKNAKNSEILTV